MAAEKKKRNKRIYTITLSQAAINGLTEMAEKNGYFWGGKPSTSRLLEALGTGKETLEGKSESNKKVIVFLEKCIDILKGND